MLMSAMGRKRTFGSPLILRVMANPVENSIQPPGGDLIDQIAIAAADGDDMNHKSVVINPVNEPISG